MPTPSVGCSQRSLPPDEGLHNTKRGFGADPRRSFGDVIQGAHPLNNGDTMAAAKLDPIRIPSARAEVGLAGAAGVGLC